MLGALRLRWRLLAVAGLSLASPHPVSFREGGYLPVAVLVPHLAALDMLAMFGLCFGVYFVLWLGLSFLLFGRGA